jgi:putative methyltransferase (TIGR04325 family)
LTSLRRALRILAPPIVTDFLRGGRLFPSWKAAEAAANTYADQELNVFKVERARERVVDGSFLPTNVLLLAAMSLQKADIGVTDFGGSAGDLGFDFLTAFPDANYAVVENETMVALMKDCANIKFTSVIPPECDIFFSSGTLQYLENPLSVLSAGFASARHAVVLTRNSFCDTDLFRVQRSQLFSNGSGPIPAGFKNSTISYPHRTVNENAVHAVANKYGFRFVSRIEESDGVLPHLGKVYGRQLVFLRG